MKTRKHITKLNNLFGQTRDEINQMVVEGHVRNADISLDVWERACETVLSEAERCEVVDKRRKL